MKNVIKSLIIVIAIVSLSGCSNKKEETTTSPVIINAGDSSTKKDTIEENIDTEENIDSNENEANSTNNSIEDVEKVDNNILIGTWATIQGDILEFNANNEFNGFIVELNDYANGTYKTDESTYIELTYLIKVPIENPTDVQMILNDGLEEKEMNTKYIIKEIGKSTEDNKKYLTLANNNEELYFFEYEDTLTENNELQDNSVVIEIISDEDIDSINQELIDSGINPETGLSFEDEQILIDNGIDPSTGKPFEQTPEQ